MNGSGSGRGGFLNLLDMFDGGGAGRSGDRFEGGPLSGLLNALGIDPYGLAQRMEEQRRARMGSTTPSPRPTPAPDTRRPDGIGATPASAYVPPRQYSGSGMNPSNAYVPPVPSAAPAMAGLALRPTAPTSAMERMALNPMAGMDRTLDNFNIYREPMTGEMMMNNRPMQTPLTPEELELYRYIYGAGSYR